MGSRKTISLTRPCKKNAAPSRKPVESTKILVHAARHDAGGMVSPPDGMKGGIVALGSGEDSP
jgi:hypothetical protein